MNELKFRFNVIKFLGKIQLSIPFKARMRMSRWITKFIGIFIKFEPIRKMEIPKLIIQDNPGHYDGEEWIEE